MTPTPEMLAWRKAFSSASRFALKECLRQLFSVVAALEDDPFIGNNLRSAYQELRIANDKLTRDKLPPATNHKGTPIARVTPRDGREKFCRKCQEWFPLSCFNHRQASPDGYATECRACEHKRKGIGL